jgi:PAS domain S-box-containing protein
VVILGVLFYSYTYQWFRPERPGSVRWRPLVNGVVFGVLSVVLMIARIEIGEGPYIDARAVPVALIGLFEGGPAGLLAAGLPALYRLSRGGTGAPAGAAALVATGLLGALACAWVRRDGGLRVRHALGLSAAVYAVTFLSFGLAGSYALSLFGQVWLPLLLTCVVGIAITARLMHNIVEQARLRTEHERFRAILDEASEAVRIIDPATFRIIDVNRRDCEMSGYARSELIGRDSRELWPDDGELRARHERAAAEALAQGWSRAFGLPYRRRDGTVVSVDSTRRIAAHGGRRYEIVVFRDATEREAAEASRREAGELRAITLLAGAAAHEINNPLSVIMGSLDLLSRHVPGDAKERPWIDQALGGVRRIRDIVARMRHITRVEAQSGTGALPPILDIRKSSQEEPWTSSST